MAKKLQLHIPEPCHENWDNMTPVEKGRFCASCQKQVVDFTNMADREVAHFFKKSSTGSVCGRFMNDQLNRDIEIPKKRIPWVKYFFQFALPAFLVSCRNTMQGKVMVKEKKDKQELIMPSSTLIGDTALTIVPVTCSIETETMGFTVGDIDYVQVESSNSGIKQDTDNIIQDTITLPEVAVSAEGRVQGKIATGAIPIFVEKIDTIKKRQDDLGIVAIAGGVRRIYSDQKSSCNSAVKKDSLITKTIQRINSIFKPYPNPVRINTTLNIEWKQEEAGDYTLQLLNQSGQLVFNKTMWIDEEATVLDIQVPNVPVGSYFLRMTNKLSGKSYTEKVIIQ